MCGMRKGSWHTQLGSAHFRLSIEMVTARNEEQLKRMRPILLLAISNIFMTFAWYGHLKFRSEALWKVILASWGIAFFEYCFQVPANRIGSYEFIPAQLKTIQEIITLPFSPCLQCSISGTASNGIMAWTSR